MNIYSELCQDRSLQLYKPPPPPSFLLPPHPPQPPVFVPSLSFVCLSLQNSWPEAQAFSLSVSSICQLPGLRHEQMSAPSSLAWAWRCVGVVDQCRGWPRSKWRLCIDTSGDNKREQWYGWTPGSQWGKQWLTDRLHACIPFSPLWKECLWKVCVVHLLEAHDAAWLQQDIHCGHCPYVSLYLWS